MMTKHIRNPEQTWRRPEILAVFAAASLLFASGCQQLFGFTWVRPGSMSPAELRGEEEPVPLDERDGANGTLATHMRQMGIRRKGDYRKTGSSLKAAEGREDFAKAQEFYNQKQYPSAEKLAQSIVKAHKNSPIREDALFLMAEAQYQQKRYPYAADSYIALGKEFPSTRYQKTRAKRLFTIARNWLKNTEYVTTGNVELASHDDSGKTNIHVIPNAKKLQTSKDPSRLIPIFPNFHDRSRPMFDTDGRAIEALKSIWQNDPTGSLADDALMLTASYHIRKRDFIEADHIYKILREEYPKSPHAQNAFVLGSFVKRASYQGPAYDGQALDQAKQLNESTLRLYPNHPDRDRIRDDMRKIVEHKAAQEWQNVVFYQRKGRPASVAVCAKEVIRLYPTSTYADRARQLLRNMRAEAQPVVEPKQEPEEPGAPRRLFRLPKFAIPALPKFGKAQPEIRDSRNDSEKTGVGTTRI